MPGTTKEGNWAQKMDARASVRATVALALLAVIAAGAKGQVAPRESPDKRNYDLFHPTPRERLREMSTDRPDQTESPYTVDAGHFQIELDWVNGVWDRGTETRSETIRVAPINFKAGLLNSVDLQFVLEPYARARVEDRISGAVDESSGFGDVQTRVKINLWGNDGGRSALGIMPFIKWPLPKSGLRNGKTEGGLLLPFALDLGDGWGLGAQTGVELAWDETGGYNPEFLNAITVGRNLTDRLGMYLEFFTVAGSAAEFEWEGQIDVGWTYVLGENVRFDWGCNFGVTRSAPDFSPFTGLSFRF